MGDYLARIIERARGTAQIVQPLTPTLFDRETPDRAPLEDSLAAHEDHDAASSPKPDSSVLKAAQKPLELHPMDDDIMSWDNSMGRKEDSLSQPECSKRSLGEQKSEQPPVRPATEPVAREDTPNRQSKAPDLVPTESGIDASESFGKTPVNTPRVSSVKPRQLMARSGHRGVHLDRIEPPLTCPSVNHHFGERSIEVNLSHPSSSSGLTNAVSREQLVSTVPPAIKITIGRIDVRAVTEQKARPRRESQPTPELSLDEYLRRRNGGDK